MSRDKRDPRGQQIEQLQQMKPKRKVLEFCVLYAGLPFQSVLRGVERDGKPLASVNGTLWDVLKEFHAEGWTPMVALGDLYLILKREQE